MLKKIKWHRYFLAVIFLFIIIAVGYVLTIFQLLKVLMKAVIFFILSISLNIIAYLRYIAKTFPSSKYIIEKTSKEFSDIFFCG
jgi:hypothetical protein